MDLLIKKGEQLLKYGAFVKPFTRAYVSAFEFGLKFVTFISTIPAFLDFGKHVEYGHCRQNL